MRAKKVTLYSLTGFSKNNLQLLRLLIQQELTLRYKRSVIGIGWTLLNPMLTSFVLWVVFSFHFGPELKNNQQFAPYLMAGILISTFFNQGIIKSANSIASNGNILTKVSVPPIIFAFASSISAYLNFLIGLLPLTLVVYISGQTLSYFFPLVFILGIFLTLFISGLGLMLSIVFIRFDDAKNVVNVLLMILIYLTPIFYPINILSENLQTLVNANPLTSYLDVFRWSFSNNSIVSIFDFVYIFITANAFIFSGIFVFKKYWPKTVTML